MDTVARPLAWLAGLPADLRIALRRLLRRPAFTASAVLIFAVGTGFSTALAGVYQALFLRPLPYENETRLVAVLSTFPDPDGRPRELVSSGFDYLQWRGARSFTHWGAHTPQDVSVLLGDRVERLGAEAVTSSLFGTFGTRPLIGRVIGPDDEREGAAVAVLSHEFWALRMGADSSIIGRSLRIDGRPHVVIGVLQRGFTTLFQKSDLYVPLVITPANHPPSGRRIYAVVARLAVGVESQQAQAELTGISQRLAAEFPASNRGWGATVKPLREQYLGSRRPLFRLLIGGVALVVLIGCANLAHLSLTSALARRTEFELRIVLGAARPHLIRQQVAESALLALGGGALGLAMAAGVIGLLFGVDPEMARLAGAIRLDASLASFALLLAFLASLLGTALPSLIGIGNFTTLRAGTRSSGTARDWLLRQGMLTGEVALGMLLLLGAAVVGDGLLRALKEDPGFEPGGLVAAELVLPAPRYAEASARTEFVRRLLEGLRSSAGVSAAAVTMTRFRPQQSMSSEVAGEGVAGDPAVSLAVALRRISTDYLATTKVRLIAGREFTEADGPDAPKVAMISESMAKRYWPGKDAFGRRFKRPPASPDWVTVVGVVGDTRDSGPGFDLGPTVLVPYSQSSSAGVSFAPVTVMVRTSAPIADAASVIRRTVTSLDPDLALEPPLAVEEHLAGALAPQRFQAILIATFGATALLLVAAGLYGVTAHGVSQRRREIGIRLALGARRAGVVGLILRQALLPVAVGTALGLFASGWVTALAGRLLPSSTATPFLLVALVAGFLTAIGVMSTLLPALAASAIDPAATLKEENT